MGALADPAAFAKKVHLLWIGVGTEEPAQMHAGIVRLHDAFTEANIKHVLLRVAGHLARMADMAPRLERFLRRGCFQTGSQHAMAAR